MSLIGNEIWLMPDLNDSFIICYADTRLTLRAESNTKKKYSKGHKLFKIEYLNGTVSFWGATALFEKNVQKSLSDWLPKFITRHHHCDSLISFAEELRTELNMKMHKPFLQTEASGFHLSCVRADGVPEFIHFSNCGLDDKTGNYGNITNEFRGLNEDFLKRDIQHFNWDGTTTNYPKVTGFQLYRNGSIKAHSAAWQKLDEVYSILFSYAEFAPPYSHKDDDIKKFVKQKLTFISSIYDNWAKTKLVGAPWDIIILRRKKWK